MHFFIIITISLVVGIIFTAGIAVAKFGHGTPRSAGVFFHLIAAIIKSGERRAQVVIDRYRVIDNRRSAEGSPQVGESTTCAGSSCAQSSDSRVASIPRSCHPDHITLELFARPLRKCAPAIWDTPMTTIAGLRRQAAHQREGRPGFPERPLAQHQILAVQLHVAQEH